MCCFDSIIPSRITQTQSSGNTTVPLLCCFTIILLKKPSSSSFVNLLKKHLVLSSSAACFGNSHFWVSLSKNVLKSGRFTSLKLSLYDRSESLKISSSFRIMRLSQVMGSSITPNRLQINARLSLYLMNRIVYRYSLPASSYLPRRRKHKASKQLQS